jgi:PilZ domain
MSVINRRRHNRLPLPASIRVTHWSFGSMVVQALNISNSGMFVKNGDHPYPSVGVVLQVQALDIPIEAPVLDARVVHVASDGVGLEFCDSGD